MDIFNEIVAGEQRETERRKINLISIFFRFVLVCLVLVVVGGFFVWRNLAQYSIPVRISKETTYITNPLHSDGSRIDYFAALEQKAYPPGMKTDTNGYRLLAQALGPDAELKDAEQIRMFNEKLALNPETKPTHPPFVAPAGYLDQLLQKNEVSKDVFEKPWRLQQIPEMKGWFDKHEPTLNLAAQAVREESFRIPYLKKNDDFSPINWLYTDTTLIHIARGFQARANLRIGSGDLDGAIEDIISCRRLGRLLGSQGLFIDAILGIAIEHTAQSIGIAASLEYQPTEEQLTRLMTGINTLPPRFNFDEIAENERYFILEHILQMSLHRDKWDELNEFTDISNFSKTFSCDWNVVFARVNENFDQVIRTGDFMRFEPKMKDYLSIKSRSILLADEFSANIPAMLGGFKNGIRRAECMEKMQRITLAILLYNAKNGELPSEYTSDPEGRKLHSWRVHLLPYLKLPEADTLYNRINLKEQWDTLENAKFHEAAIPFYQCPANETKSGNTSYALIVGENLAFDVGVYSKKMSDLPQTGADMIFVAETTASNNWMNPSFDIHEAFASAEMIKHNAGSGGISSQHDDGANLGLRSGAVRFCPDSTSLDELRDLISGTESL